MPRGFSWMIYVDDNGTGWSLQVDADQALDPARGWDPVLLSGMGPLPRGWRPREVFGIDSTGVRRFTRVGRTDADLWTGVAGAFDIETNDNGTQTVLVLGRRAEHRRVPVLG